MLASLININKYYNGNQVLNNVSLTIDESDKIGLVGNNGCGKSTLLKILTGSVDPDRTTEKDGIVSLASKTTIGYLEQMGGLNSENTVIEEMRSVFAPIHRAIDRLREIEIEIEMGDNSSADEYQQLSSWVEANDGYNTDVKIRTILNGMGFTGEAAMMGYTIILAINRPIEMLVTSLNCVGDSVAAVVVAKSEGKLDEETFNA